MKDHTQEKSAETSIDDQIKAAQKVVDDLQAQLTADDADLKKAQEKRSKTAKAHRSALGKLVTLESIKRTK